MEVKTTTKGEKEKKKESINRLTGRQGKKNIKNGTKFIFQKNFNAYSTRHSPLPQISVPDLHTC